MKIMKKLAIILATILIAASCTGGYQPTEKTFTVNSTVNAYFTFIRVKENEQPFHNVIAARRSDEELCVMLSLVGGFTGSVYDLMDDPYGKEAQAYEAAQEKFGDFNTNRSVYRYMTSKNDGQWFLESGPCTYYCFSEQIADITITSDKQWAEGYAAGADLSELFVVEFTSLAGYVKRGFTGTPHASYRRIVSELDYSELSLLVESDYNIYGGVDLTFYSSVMPENINLHTITITLTLDTDEQLNYSMKLTNAYI